MDTDTETLQRLLKAKEDALTELKLSFEEFKEEANEYERELEADNEHKEKEIEALHKKLESVSKKMEDYKKEISQSNRIMEREKGKFESLSEELSALKTRIVHLEQINEELERDIRNIKFEKQELMEKLEELEEKFVIEREDLEEQLKQKNDDLERFRLDVHEYEDELVLWKRKSLHKSIRSGPGSMVDVGEQTDAEKIAHLQEEMTKYRDELERLSDQLGDKNRDIIGYTSKIADIEAEIEQLRGSLEQKEKEIEEKDKDLTETRNENVTLKQKLEEKENCITELNGKVEAEQLKNKEFQEQINELVVQHTKQNSVMVEESGCIASEEDRESQKTGEDSRIKEDTERLLMDIQEKEEIIGQLNTELGEVKEHLEEEKICKCQLESLITGLSAELEEGKAINNELRKEIEEKSRPTHREVYTEISEYNEENRSPMRSPSYIENMSPSTYYAKEGEDETETAGRNTVGERKVMENMEDMVNRMQEENIKLNEKYQNLMEVVGFLEKKVSAIQDDKTQLEMDLYGRDQKIAILERMYEELQKELNMAKENQNPITRTSEKIPKLDIPEAYRSDLDTMPTDHYQSTNRNGAALFNNVNGVGNGKKLFSKNLYIKQSQDRIPSYIKVQDNFVLLGDKNEPETLSKSYSMDGIFYDVQDINLQETLGLPLSEALGKNLMVLIYGNKSTDKKHLRYKILQDFIKLFRAMSVKDKFQDKICKVSIKLEDSTIMAKVQKGKNGVSLDKVNTFTIGNIESEQELYEYCKAVKDIYNSKDKKNSSPTKMKTALKQIILELSVENTRKDSRSRSQNNQAVQRIKIVVASINSQAQEECGSPLSLFARKSANIQENSVERFIFMAVNPSASSESYTTTANILEFAEKLENVSQEDQDFSTPVHQLETGPIGFSPDDNRKSEEKTYVPRNRRKNTGLAADANQEAISMNLDASMYSSTSYKNRPRRQSNTNNFLQGGMNRLFGFMKKLKSSKKQRSQSKSSFADPKSSVLSTKSAAPSSGVVRKLVVQLE